MAMLVKETELRGNPSLAMILVNGFQLLYVVDAFWHEVGSRPTGKFCAQVFRLSLPFGGRSGCRDGRSNPFRLTAPPVNEPSSKSPILNSPAHFCSLELVAPFRESVPLVLGVFLFSHGPFPFPQNFKLL